MMSKYPDHIPITPEMSAELIGQRDRTGIGAIVIYRHMIEHGFLKPGNKITVQRIESWFTGIAKSTVEEDFKSVISAYESISEEELVDIIPRCGALREDIGKDFLARLNHAFRPRPNFSRARFLKRHNAPKALTAAKIQMILSGKAETISTEHKKFLEKAIIFLNNQS